MFPLHDRTRRRISLVAFFSLCIVPTALALGWGLTRYFPGHARAEAERLRDRLGYQATLEGVRHLGPGIVLYSGLELRDPETDQTVFRCRALRAEWTPCRASSGQRRPGLRLKATGPEIDLGQFDRMSRVVEQVLARRTHLPVSVVELEAANLMLRSGDNRQQVRELLGRIEMLPKGAQADLAFRLPEVDSPKPIHVRIARSCQSDRPTSGLGFHTGETSVSCSLLGVCLPEFQAFGPKSRFRGYVWSNRTPAGCDAELAGELIDLDLDGLASRCSPHVLRGTGTLTVHRAEFRDGRLVEATVSLEGGPGEVSRSLLDGAVEHLAMPRGTEPASSEEIVAYSRLALWARLNGDGLDLRGECTPEGAAVSLMGRRGPLLGDSAGRRIPVAGLLEALVPGVEAHLPSTPQARWFFERLPVPIAGEDGPVAESRGEFPSLAKVPD